MISDNIHIIPQFWIIFHLRISQKKRNIIFIEQQKDKVIYKFLTFASFKLEYVLNRYRLLVTTFNNCFSTAQNPNCKFSTFTFKFNLLLCTENPVL